LQPGSQQVLRKLKLEDLPGMWSEEPSANRLNSTIQLRPESLAQPGRHYPLALAKQKPTEGSTAEKSAGKPTSKLDPRAHFQIDFEFYSVGA
jgi:hypothetical protein